MERLRENNFLMSAIAISTAVVVALSFGLSSDLSNTFEIIEFPEEVIIWNKLAFRLILSIFLSLSSLKPFQLMLFIPFFQFRNILIAVLVGDAALAFAVDRICSFLFGSVRKNDLCSI